MINLHQLDKSQVIGGCTDFIYQHLTAFLSKGPTLLLVSGGSVATEALPVLAKQLAHVSFKHQLTLGLVDERFGPPWHKDSNMLTVKNSGLLDVVEQNGRKALFPLLRVVRGRNLFDPQLDRDTIQVTYKGIVPPRVRSAQIASSSPTLNNNYELKTLVEQYTKDLAEALIECKGRSIGVFGMGADGHTAGMLPQPTQEEFDELFGGERLVVHYQGPDFERITITPRLMQHLSLSVVYACGTGKRFAIKALIQGNEVVYRQPALVLAGHPNAHLFSDQTV